jgi:thiol-disulfide isomerase/thioredoxin
MMHNKSRTKSRIPLPFARIRAILVGVIVLVILHGIGLFSAVSLSDTEVPRPEFNYAFTLKDLEGNRIPVESFKGKVIFLNLWATWCGPCRAEMPGIQSLYNKVDNEKIIFIMLSIDRDQDLAKVKKYVRDKSFTFNTYLPSGYLTEQLDVSLIPTTYVVSRDGRIMKREVGAKDYDTPSFRKFLENLAD